MKQLETQTKKWVIATLLALAMISGGILMLPIIAADEVGETPTRDEWSIQLRNQNTLYRIKRRDTILTRFIQAGTYEALEGVIITTTPRLLVIDCDGQAITVMIPTNWVFNGAIVDAQDLLDGEPFGPDDALRVETLMLKLEKDNHTITSYLAFALRVDADTATALLPFNVELE